MSDEKEKIEESVSPKIADETAEPITVGVDAGGAAVAKTGQFPRKNIFQISAETIEYIEKAEKDKSIHFRNDDKTSTIFLFLALIFSAILAFALILSPSNRHLCVALALVSDFLFGMAILWFVLLRFGVLRTIEPRFALLTWQLMLGAGVLFAFYTMNVAFFFFTLSKSMPTSTTPGM